MSSVFCFVSAPAAGYSTLFPGSSQTGILNREEVNFNFFYTVTVELSLIDTCLQQPLFSVPKVAIVERFNCI